MSRPVRFDSRLQKSTANSTTKSTTKVQFKNVNPVILLLNFLLASVSPANCFEYWSRFAPVPQGAVGLGDACKSALHCLLFIPNSQCNWDQRVCECQPYHIASPNNTMCLPGVLLTFECEIDAQCELRVPNSRCSAGRCACKENHSRIRFDKCLPPASLDGYCLNNEMCSSADPYAHCKWIVPRAYGKCKCLEDHFYSAADKRCYPRLGHTCYKNSDCQKSTQNSKCGNLSDQKNTLIVVKASVRKHNEKHKLTNKNRYTPHSYPPKYSSSSAYPKYSHVAKTGYRSASRQSKLTKNFRDPANSANSCRCSADYKESEDRTSCIKVSKRPASVVHLAPMVYPVASASNNINHRVAPKRPFPPPHEPFNSSLNLLPVSIGKRCRNSYECKLRDPYTYCSPDGVCDCINRNSKCSAQNNTGCYPDTFQCRDGTCISWYFVCDGQPTCEDNSDESECVRYACPKEAFQCDDGHCITKAKVCDGKADCLDGSDESQCKRHQCGEQSFRSRDGQCLPLYTFCNAVVDAADKSDEDRSVCESSQKCPEQSFQCRNGKCRSTAILCSGADGCSDNSDEEKCYACYCDRPTS